MRRARYQPDVSHPAAHPFSGRGSRRLRPRHSWHEQVLAATGNAVIALSSELRITYFNLAAEQLYGCSADSALGRPFHEVINTREPDGTPTPARAGRFPLPGLGSGAEIHITPLGVEIPVRVSLVQLADDDDPSHRFVAIIRDDRDYRAIAGAAADRMKFEMLLCDLSARFSRFVGDDVDGEIELWLRRLAEHLDVQRSSFAQLTPDGGMVVTHVYAAPGIPSPVKWLVNDRLPWLVKELSAHRVVAFCRVPDDLPDQAALEREYFTSAGIRAGIAIPVSIGQSLICVLTFGSFTRERSWPPELIARLRLVGDVFGNAIERKQANQKLAQKQNELVHVGRVAAVGELASVIAHELDQPLTAVVSNAQAIRYILETREPDLAEADEALADVIDAAMRISDIVIRERRLLKNSAISFAPLDLNEIIRDIELFIRGEARQDGAKLSLELQPGLPKILADRVQLQQVILNLTRNGFQAMSATPREKRHLRVRTSRHSGELVLAVSDCGPPVDEAQLEKMFEPFFTTKAQGLGMGLAISRTIVEKHHGRMWATRNPNGGGGGGGGGGLSVHVAIPLTDQSDHHEQSSILSTGLPRSPSLPPSRSSRADRTGR